MCTLKGNRQRMSFAPSRPRDSGIIIIPPGRSIVWSVVVRNFYSNINQFPGFITEPLIVVPHFKSTISQSRTAGRNGTDQIGINWTRIELPGARSLLINYYSVIEITLWTRYSSVESTGDVRLGGLSDFIGFLNWNCSVDLCAVKWGFM